HRQLLLGLGVDDPDLLAEATSPAEVPGGTVVPADPYLLCLGRVDQHKGSHLLAALFSSYKERHPGPLRLVFAGPVVDAPAHHADIDVVGPVSDSEKWALLGRAVALVSPRSEERRVGEECR